VSVAGLTELNGGFRLDVFSTPGSTVQTPQDPKDLKIIAQAVRSQGFVCARPSYLRLVGMTERGEQVRLVCNAETLQYRMTMSPDRKHITIRPWSE
jgi:hypothetical protein